MERHTRRIGADRCAERDAAVAAFQALPLVERKAAPKGVVAPDLAVVSVDGGRLPILDRTAEAAGNTPLSPDDDSDATSPDGKSRGTHWREDKIGLLLTMQSAASAVDPCPTVPACFVDPTRILKRTRELKTKRSAEGDDGLAEPASDRLPDPLRSVVSEPTAADVAAGTAPSPAAGTPVTHGAASSAADAARATPALPVYAPPSAARVSAGPQGAPSGPAPCDTPSADGAAEPARYQPPKVPRRSAVATRQSWQRFGPLVAAAAWAAGFFGAARQAFVTDGAANHWTWWRRHFSSFTPVLDLIHALSYVFASAMAGRRFAEGWPVHTVDRLGRGGRSGEGDCGVGPASGSVGFAGEGRRGDESTASRGDGPGLPAGEPGADALRGVPQGGVAHDVEFSGESGEAVQRSGEGERPAGYAFWSDDRGGGDPAVACGRVERRRGAGRLLRAPGSWGNWSNSPPPLRLAQRVSYTRSKQGNRSKGVAQRKKPGLRSSRGTALP